PTVVHAPHMHFSRLSSFLSHYSLHLRHLHSFPTRRSSDLDDLRPRLQPHSPHRNLQRRSPRIHRDRMLTSRVIANGLLELLQAIDRKSTRLNSSHGSISYAVFCLKKKTTQIQNTTAQE